MFCPNCKTEYRAGFTQCSDCGATLVDTLPNARSDDDVPELFWSGNSPRLYQEFRAALKAANIPFMDEPPPRLLYSSLRPPLEIWTSKLDHEAAAKVRYQITGESDDEIAGKEDLSDLQQTGGRSPNPYRDPTRPTRPSGFLGTPVDGDYQQRTEPPWMGAWTTKATEGQTAGEENAGSDEPIENAGIFDDGSNLLKTYFTSDAPDDIFSGEFFPEDATAQVYSGDLDLAQGLQACLRENGIPSTIDEQENPGNNKAKLRVLPDHQARAKEIIREVIEATPPE
jgi:hypothetical protein